MSPGIDTGGPPSIDNSQRPTVCGDSLPPDRHASSALTAAPTKGKKWEGQARRGSHKGDTLKTPGRFVVAAALGGVLLSGCSQPPGGVVMPATRTVTPTSSSAAVPSTPTSTPPAPPAPSVTPTAGPTMPPDARQITPEGAEAFTRYWIDTYNWMLVSNDSSLFDEATTKECEFCKRVKADLRDSQQKGVTAEGGLVALRALSVPEGVSPGRTEVAIVYDEAAVTSVAADGQTTTRPPVSNASGFVVLTADGQGWMVAGVAKS